MTLKQLPPPAGTPAHPPAALPNDSEENLRAELGTSLLLINSFLYRLCIVWIHSFYGHVFKVDLFYETTIVNEQFVNASIIWMMLFGLVF